MAVHEPDPRRHVGSGGRDEVAVAGPGAVARELLVRRQQVSAGNRRGTNARGRQTILISIAVNADDRTIAGLPSGGRCPRLARLASGVAIAARSAPLPPPARRARLGADARPHAGRPPAPPALVERLRPPGRQHLSGDDLE